MIRENYISYNRELNYQKKEIQMFNKIKESWNDEKNQERMKLVVDSIAIGVITSITVSVLTVGFDAARERISQTSESSSDES